VLATGLALGAALTLSACGDDLDESRSLLERVQVRQGGPDPFLVIERAPLEIPAQLGALPPPQPGAPSRVEPQPDLLVASALGGNARGFSATPGVGEQRLLASLGATDVPADIRAQIEEDHQRTLEGRDPGILTRAFAGIGNPYRNQQLDPVAEVVRLRRVYPGVVTPSAPLSTPR
jgi:hypothetical protein